MSFFCCNFAADFVYITNMPNIQKIEPQMALTTTDPEYVRLVSQISNVWDEARSQAFNAINTALLMANWHTGEYIVEFEQHGNVKAEYGKQLLTNLSKDLTRLRGKGYSRSNLFNMRQFYLRFPKIQTVSGQLTWSHYTELLNQFLPEVNRKFQKFTDSDFKKYFRSAQPSTPKN